MYVGNAVISHGKGKRWTRENGREREREWPSLMQLKYLLVWKRLSAAKNKQERERYRDRERKKENFG